MQAFRVLNPLVGIKLDHGYRIDLLVENGIKRFTNKPL